MSYASRVASMLAAMNSCSLSASDGLTWNCCTMPGQIRPSRIAETASSARPTDGSSQVRRQTLTKKRIAQITEIPSRMFLAGSTALWSVYVMPVISGPPWVTRSKRSSQ